MDPEAAPFEPVADSRPADLPWPPMRWPPVPEQRLGGRFVELARFDPLRDAEPLYEALNYDEVWQHVPGRPEDVTALIKAILVGEGEGRFTWAIRLLRPYAGAEEGAVVGMSSYLDVSPTDARLEIGWTLYTPRVWGTAVNTDAKLQLLGLAFEVLGAGRVQLKTDVRNTRSQRAIARLGARYEGTLRRYQRRSDGTVRDSVLFSVAAEEWPIVRERLSERLDALTGAES